MNSKGRNIVSIIWLAIALITLSSQINRSLASREDGHTEEVKLVSYGSIIKVQHVASGHRLHSHEVNYGSGSAQQSVTGTPIADDENSFWVVKGPHGEPKPAQGTPVACNSVIRLEHLTTRKNLHSHLHLSPFQNQEVSAYASDGNANGDGGDNFRVVCRPDVTHWERFATVSFEHVGTGMHLQANPKNKYNQPIAHQIEVSCTAKKSANTQWKSNEGIYFVNRG